LPQKSKGLLGILRKVLSSAQSDEIFPLWFRPLGFIHPFLNIRFHGPHFFPAFCVFGPKKRESPRHFCIFIY